MEIKNLLRILANIPLRHSIDCKYTNDLLKQIDHGFQDSTMTNLFITILVYTFRLIIEI